MILLHPTVLFYIRPFSHDRVAWNTISVIDPLFTIPVFILLVFAIFKRNKTFTAYAIAWVLVYQTVAYSQKNRAEEIILDHAQKAGHNIVTLEAKPSFGNIVVWKVIYSTKDKYYVNAIRLGLNHKIYHGESIDKLSIKKSFRWLDNKSQQAIDLEKFRWFSNGYLAVDKDEPNKVYDIRFSTIPNQVEGLWGIRLDENKNMYEHVEYITNRKETQLVLK